MSRLTPEMLSYVGRRRTPVMELATRREIRKYSVAIGIYGRVARGPLGLGWTASQQNEHGNESSHGASMP